MDAAARRVATTTDAFFLASPGRAGGRRFCLLNAPADPRGTIVYVHPFAEEMNKSRRMAALQARAFAAAGHAVLQVDLFGCGDSSGDFGDAAWDDWIDDVQLASDWLVARFGSTPLLWGLRAGCLVALAAAERAGEPRTALFWQPAASGKTVLQQFLRLRTAAERLAGTSGGGVEDLRDRLAAGETIDVAGYRIAPELAAGLEAARLEPSSAVDRLAWLEIASGDHPALTPAGARAVDNWRAAGVEVDADAVSGPAFWQTTEIEVAPALIDASVRALGSARLAA
ncbi:hydrolase 2, exosortase A system-associated [Piscinibacter koreensis]|uniref:Hydrolase 2, exosortase A system-associated n=1 Tax=Piscinibacter koreensis TaxID=2742824 RepID=A0A7Y6NL26_9BURK|nr:hydrolase 2, exosortase A system-associated [Schlegelella koreensis]NUZ05183.1 hydrolase 2, exosortase A system-associated [Schlegelella koreensis]